MKLSLLLLVLLLVVAVVGSGIRRLAPRGTDGIWTPAPISGAALFATPATAILPTLPAPTPAATAARPSPTTVIPRPSATPLPPPAAIATPDPNLVVITEADVVAAVAGGGAEQGGAEIEGLTVRFTDGRMIFRAERLRYGQISVVDLTLTGRLVAKDGKLALIAESVAPRGLVTALIPTFANQALAQYTAQWYIEEVRTLEGKLELRIR